MEDRIRAAYHDPETFGNAKRVYDALKESADAPPGLTLKKVQDVIKHFEYDQRVHKIPRVFMPIVGRQGEHQMDLMFFKSGGQIKNILTVVDVTTRYAYARHCKTRDGPVIAEQLAEVIREANDRGWPIKYLVSDNEFAAGTIRALLNRERISYYFAQPEDKTTVSAIESFNGTLREKLTQYVHTIGSGWLTHLQAIVRNYNHSVHSGLGGKSPAEVTPRDTLRLRGNKIVKMRAALLALLAIRRAMDQKKAEGAQQHVRTSVKIKTTDPFRKFGPNFSKDLFKVMDIKGYSVVVRHTQRATDASFRYRPRQLVMVDKDSVQGHKHKLRAEDEDAFRIDYEELMKLDRILDRKPRGRPKRAAVGERVAGEDDEDDVFELGPSARKTRKRTAPVRFRDEGDIGTLPASSRNTKTRRRNARTKPADTPGYVEGDIIGIAEHDDGNPSEREYFVVTQGHTNDTWVKESDLMFADGRYNEYLPKYWKANKLKPSTERGRKLFKDLKL